MKKRLFELIENYPGFCLNSVAILICIGINIYNLHDCHTNCDARVEVVEQVTKTELSNVITKSRKAEQAYNNIRTELSNLLQDNAVTAVGDRYSDTQKTINRVGNFLDKLNIEKIINETNTINMNQQVEYICGEVDLWLKSEMPYLANAKIIWCWIFVALGYLFIVGVSFLGWNLEMEQSEPILNIIDVGLYLALIEYSGGFESDIMWLIPISVVIAIVDFIRLRRLIIKKFNSVRIALKWKEYSTLFSTFSPTLLYMFALFAGLIWATIGLETPNLDHTYIFRYAANLSFILIGGGIGSIVFYFSTSLISKYN